jgi:ATP/maltotriose-dependent transcriptional regulator MalT
MDLLVDLLEEANKGHGRLALVAGEAGAGKTSLVGALVERASRHALVLVGACDPLSTPRPLSPLLDIALDPASGLGDIAQLNEQHEVFAALLGRLRQSIRPVLMVIEDTHWADEATVDMIRFVGRRIANSKALVVVTYRPHEVGRNKQLQVLLGDLAAAGTAIKVEVPALTIDAVRALSAGRGFDPTHLHRITGGNAFFVTEVIAAGQFVPASVRDAVLARVLRLSEGAQGVVEAVSIAPRAIEIKKALQLTEATPADADEAVARGVLLAEDGQLRFRHELARSAVETSMSPVRRQSLHRKMIDQLIAGGHQDQARLAHHATEAGDRELIAQYAPAAADEAIRRGAIREAVRFFEAALASPELLDDAAELRLRLATQLYVVDRQSDALSQAELALETYRAGSDPTRLARALSTVARYQWTSGNTKAVWPYLEEAIAVLEARGPSPDLAEALYLSAHQHMLARHHQPAIEQASAALQMAKHLNSTVDQVRATIALGTSELATGDPDRGFELLARARRMSEETGNRRALMTVLGMIGSGGGEVRRYREAEPALVEAISLGQAWDEDYSVAYDKSWLARIRFDQGRWDEAVDWANQVEALAREGTAPISWITARTARGRVSVRRGDQGGIGLLEEVVEHGMGAELQHRWPGIAGIAEYRWLIGAADRIGEVVIGPYGEAIETDSAWARGELGFWMWRAGLIGYAPERAATPFALQIDGEWRAAAEAWHDIGCPYEEAMALADGDQSALLASLEILDGLEARPLASLVRRRLRERGVEHIPRGPRAATKADKAGLTSRQREVLELMARGLTNAEIAERLYLTKKTVEHHVSAILQKVGVDSRAKAVAAVKDGGNTKAI